MGATEDILAPARLSRADVADGLVLSREAGWNQTAEDWRLFFERGLVFGIRDEGRVIATAALLPSPPLTWISMVLVAVAYRRRGFADRLMRHCIDEAQSRSWQPWLDATPAGAAVYRTLGFSETQFGIARMRRPATGSSTSPSHAATMAEPSDAEALLDADREALGFDRAEALRALTERGGSSIYRQGTALALVRTGDRARHIGPVYADHEDAAIEMLERITEADDEPLLIDIANDRPKLHQWCGSRGFVFERPFARMCLGAPGNVGSRNRLMAVAGPEFG